MVLNTDKAQGIYHGGLNLKANSDDFIDSAQLLRHAGRPGRDRVVAEVEDKGPIVVFGLLAVQEQDSTY